MGREREKTDKRTFNFDGCAVMSTSKPKQSGLSLIELLAAMTILAIIMATVTMIISGGLRTLQRSGKTHTQFVQERAIFESLQADLSSPIDKITLEGNKLAIMEKESAIEYIIETGNGKVLLKRQKEGRSKELPFSSSFPKPEFKLLEGYSPEYQVLQLKGDADSEGWLFLIEKRE